jgi:hypothetical protein
MNSSVFDGGSDLARVVDKREKVLSIKPDKRDLSIR